MPEFKFQENCVTVESVFNDGITIKEFDLYPNMKSDTIIHLSDLKPLSISIDLLREIGLESDNNSINEIFNEQWELLKYGNLKLAYQLGAIYKYKEVFDHELGKYKVQVFDNHFKYIHEVQNLISN